MKLLKTFLSSALLATTLGSVSFAANANLLVNGGFETPNVNNNSWKYFSANDVDGWNGSNLEIWNNYSISASEGNQFAELNSHPHTGQVFSIFQDFATVDGQWYDVSFDYRARANNNEAFRVDINNGAALTSANIQSWLIDDHTKSSWSTFSGSFQATSAISSIAFTTVMPSTGTVGNFIDDVRVSAVSEPATIALLGLGLLGLGAARKRLNK